MSLYTFKTETEDESYTPKTQDINYADSAAHMTVSMGLDEPVDELLEE